MFLDHSHDAFHRFRNQLSIVVWPLQCMVSIPIDGVNSLISTISRQQTLLKENATLQAQILLLNAELQRQQAIESENQQLHALLQSSQDRQHFRMEIAKLLAVSTDPILREITLNKGEGSGAFVGQPVMDAFGIMGQIIDTEFETSRVMLISDPRSAIPVQIRRNGIRGLAVGVDQAKEVLKLDHVAETQDIQVGDEVVTSGLGGRFSLGYPVGKIISVRNNPSGQFADITIAPAARLNQSRLVLLLWPKEIQRKGHHAEKPR